ncbi:DUF624 domain-containing protein [Amphibacillus sp. MSJ-3]|uniref:YesL family protein n=1 Tax=Amphibacillus sp. MSJ-3 TaxID=2841505 RepID=UPI001C0F1120|nr:DUF624 domain-containing protein [Amphibacillus sp. MSJ-3]MBU5595090.1 DUF624 domain-containing protein [Amphibacillus sp. MSJ-3]
MTIEKINNINDIMIGILTVAYLNLLWFVFTIAGFGLFTIGPATYAMMKYYDRWLRLKEKPKITKSFWTYFKERYLQSLFISWIVLALFTIITVNLFSLTQWYYQVANVLVFVILIFAFSHVYTVMAATKFATIKEIIRGSAMLGLGYLHYSIIAWTIIVASYFLFFKYSPALLFLFGVGFYGFVLAFFGKTILLEFTPREEDAFEKDEEDEMENSSVTAH